LNAGYFANCRGLIANCRVFGIEVFEIEMRYRRQEMLLSYQLICIAPMLFDVLFDG
jgi:hypothetical protein